MTICPDEDDLMGFAQGLVDPSLEAHVEACDGCRAAVAMLASMQSEPGETHAPALLAGRFALGDTLGAGGLGLVVAAHDTRLGVDIAVKLLRPDRPLTDERLDAEVRTARQVRHPNVCAVFDLGQDGDRRFITMERVDGRPLPAWIAEVAPCLAQRRSVLYRILDGVAAAHACGVVHRDLKPGNVMIDAEGQPKVMDFGLAIDARSTDHGRGRVGTPAWWAPEQGRGEPATTRSDVYAIGALARWLLPEARGRMLRWISICQAEDPDARFADAAAARGALPVRRPRRRYGALAAVAVLAIGFVGAWPSRSSVAPEPSMAAQPSKPAWAPGPEAKAAFRKGHDALRSFVISHAMPSLLEATRLEPTYAQAHLWLAYANRWFGDSADARRSMDTALLHIEQLAEIDRLFLLALEADLRHDRVRARALLERMLAQEPDHCAASLSIADIDFHDGRFAQAAEAFDRFAAERQGPAQIWHHLMWARFAEGGLEPALAVIDRWAEATSSHRPGQERTALLMAAAPRDRAQAALEVQRVGSPRSIRFLLFAGIVAFEERGLAAAYRVFDDALAGFEERRTKARVSFWRQRGWLSLAAGDSDGATAALWRTQAARHVHLDRAGNPAGNNWIEVQAEHVWARVVTGAPPDDSLPGLASLSASAEVHGNRYASMAVAMACLAADDRPCLEAIVESDWPTVRAIARAHRRMTDGDATAGELMRETARRTPPMHQPGLWLAAHHIHHRTGDDAAAAEDLQAASRYTFPTPYSVVARALSRRAAAP